MPRWLLPRYLRYAQSELPARTLRMYNWKVHTNIMREVEGDVGAFCQVSKEAAVVWIVRAFHGVRYDSQAFPRRAISEFYTTSTEPVHLIIVHIRRQS